jgi:phospholipid N-methyltransferase
MTSFTATYSPEDNKLRLYASTRLDAETYARVKAAGFKWAPKQDLFVAPMWTPSRDDLLTELAGEIEDEDKSLIERATERADRFDDYSDSRAADAESARKAVSTIADHIPFGQPILIGHHSEKRARKDAERIDSGMRRAVKMWETSEYWQSRAAGALAAAKYKELPAVRARRIKTLEAEMRSHQRDVALATKFLAAWSIQDLSLDQARRIVNGGDCWLTVERNEANPYGRTAYDVLREQEDGSTFWTVAQVVEVALRVYPATIAHAQRWISHYENRLIYEKAMLDEQGASDLIAKKPRPKQLPLLNYEAESFLVACLYQRGEFETLKQVRLTAEQYQSIPDEMRGTREIEKSHRIRVARIEFDDAGKLKRWPSFKAALMAVFLTDSKFHPKPDAPKAETPAAAKEPDRDVPAPMPPREFVAATREPLAESREAFRAMAASLKAGVSAPALTPTREFAAATREPLAESREAFRAMAASLKAGVQVVVAPQLFPTSEDIAAEMVELAEINPGHRVLEPSAGTGNIIKAMQETSPGLNIWAIETVPRLASALSQKFPDVRVREDDFLSWIDHGLFDRIVMNPPFENGADIKHIRYAASMLAPGGRLVALCANGPRQQIQLKPLASEWRDLPAGSFKAPGTGVNVAMLVIDRPEAQ